MARREGMEGSVRRWDREGRGHRRIRGEVAWVTALQLMAMAIHRKSMAVHRKCR